MIRGYIVSVRHITTPSASIVVRGGNVCVESSLKIRALWCYLRPFLPVFVPFQTCVMAQVVLNDVSRYLTSSWNSIPKEAIMKSAVSFYEEDAINRAEDEPFKLCNENNITRK